jgi:hypothetical protein
VDSGAHWNRPEGFCALIAIRLGSMNFGLSLPHAANARLNAAIRRDGVAGFGRVEPLAALHSRSLGHQLVRLIVDSRQRTIPSVQTLRLIGHQFKCD